MFHTCQNDVSRITASTKVLQLMIENFGASRLFGKENIHFFTSQTNTGMAVKEKMRFELQYNPNDPNLREFQLSLSTFTCIAHAIKSNQLFLHFFTGNTLELFALKIQQEQRNHGFSFDKNCKHFPNLSTLTVILKPCFNYFK